MHTALHDYDKAIEIYAKAKEIDKSKEAMLDGRSVKILRLFRIPVALSHFFCIDFIKEVQLSKSSVSQEKEARTLFESGARHPGTLVEVMNKVNSKDELPLYYDGGVRVLADLLTDGKSLHSSLPVSP